MLKHKIPMPNSKPQHTLVTRTPVTNVVPMSLRKMASSISTLHKADGAIIITSDEEGIKIGATGLTAEELKNALCVAMYHVVAQSA